MAQIRLQTDRGHHFPPVCVCCGERAVEYRRRWFIWTSGLGVIFAFLGSWRYWRVTLDVPFCSRHRHYFTWRWLPMLLLGLIVIVSAVAIYIATDVRQGKEAARELEKVLIPAVLACMALLWIVCIFVKRRGLRVSDVNGDEFTFAGVCEEFALAVNQKLTAVPEVVAVDDEPPMVIDARRIVPEAHIARPGLQTPLAEAAPMHNSWLPLIGVLILLLAGVGSLITWKLGLFRAGASSSIRLSNARVMQKMGLLTVVQVDCKASNLDDKAQYHWVIRSGGTKVMEQPLTVDRLSKNVPLQGAVAILPVPGFGDLETLIEMQLPGKPREQASNVARVSQ